jgi:hypothetical protein
MAVSRGLILQQQTSPPITDGKPIEEGKHGHLVAQILETQKELEDDSHHQSQDSQPTKVHLVSLVAYVCDKKYLLDRKGVFVILYPALLIYCSSLHTSLFCHVYAHMDRTERLLDSFHGWS